jgi:hypothetical protein
MLAISSQEAAAHLRKTLFGFEMLIRMSASK